MKFETRRAAERAAKRETRRTGLPHRIAKTFYLNLETWKEEDVWMIVLI